MSSNKKKIFCWAGWYRQNADDYKAIFVKKHLEIISEIADIYCFHIYHNKNQWWYKKYVLRENFGNVVIYSIPAFFPLKILGYLIIPFLEYKNALKQHKQIDVFHLHISYPYAAFTYLLRFCKIPKWILTEHWSGYTFADNQFNNINFLLRFLIKQALKKFDKISCVSDYLKNQMIKRFPFLEHKIFISYNIIQIPERLKTISPNNETLKLVSISNLIDHPKNISFLIKVIAHASEKIPVTLDIYGDGKDKDKLIELAEKSGILNKNIFFKGKVSNDKILDVYSQYHAFILLSKFETFSVVTAEAIANGLPVIVTKCGGPEEYVNEQNGYLVPINDLDQTIQAIKNLYENYNKFSPSQVQSTILSKFNKESIKNQFLNLYS